MANDRRSSALWYPIVASVSHGQRVVVVNLSVDVVVVDAVVVNAIVDAVIHPGSSRAPPRRRGLQRLDEPLHSFAILSRQPRPRLHHLTQGVPIGLRQCVQRP